MALLIHLMMLMMTVAMKVVYVVMSLPHLGHLLLLSSLLRQRSDDSHASLLLLLLLVHDVILHLLLLHHVVRWWMLTHHLTRLGWDVKRSVARDDVAEFGRWWSN